MSLQIFLNFVQKLTPTPNFLGFRNLYISYNLYIECKGIWIRLEKELQTSI